MVFRLAAAAAVVALVGVAALFRWSPDAARVPGLAHEEGLRGSDPGIRAMSSAVDSVQPSPGGAGPDPSPAMPETPTYLVATRSVPANIIVSTASFQPKVEIIGDDELLQTIPGLAIARVGEPGTARMVFVNGPSLGQVVRVN